MTRGKVNRSDSDKVAWGEKLDDDCLAVATWSALMLPGPELPSLLLLSGVINENEATCQMHMQRQMESCLNTLHSLQLLTSR